MSKTIEKNDIDISKLFAWTKETTVNFYGKDIPVFLRLVGDADINRARVFALRKSAELRRKLRDSSSDEYFAFIPEKNVATTDELINGILALRSREIVSDANREVKLPYPAELSSDATLEEQEKYQQAVDEYPMKVELLVRDFVTSKLEAEDTHLRSLDKEKLYTKYVDLAVNNLCESEMLKRYREMCTYFGVYSDKKFIKRLFEDFEQFDNLPSDIKNQLITEYLTLELDGEVLKKLPEVTQ